MTSSTRRTCARIIVAFAVAMSAACGTGREATTATTEPQAEFALPASMKDAICAQSNAVEDALSEVEAAVGAGRAVEPAVAERFDANVSAFKRLADDVERGGTGAGTQRLRTHLNRVSSHVAVAAIELRDPPVDESKLRDVRPLLIDLDTAC